LLGAQGAAEVLEEVAQQAAGGDDRGLGPGDRTGGRIEVDPHHRRRSADEDLVADVGRDPQAARPRQDPDAVADPHRHEAVRRPRQLVGRMAVAGEAVPVGKGERGDDDAAGAGEVVSL
jgi:hypothetical protein